MMAIESRRQSVRVSMEYIILALMASLLLARHPSPRSFTSSSRTASWTVSSELLVFVVIFPNFSFPGRALD